MSLLNTTHHSIPPRSRSEDRSLQYSRSSSTVTGGGGRAWSEEEENYLIETRQHKMPYKHIAKQLQKTELACRLHFHQLSYGAKRRRRGSSVSSVRSVPSSLGPEAAAYMAQRQLSGMSPPDSPGRTSRATSTRASSPGNPIHILPKPVMGSQPITPHNNAIRLMTQEADRLDEYYHVDKGRLLQIYDAHRSAFWTAMAREYGDNVDPFALEETYRRLCASSFGLLPPTPPNRSPDTRSVIPVPPLLSRSISYTPENTLNQAPLPSLFPQFNNGSLPRMGHGMPLPPRNSSFAISNLLTENRDIRSQQQQMRPLAV